MKLNSNQRAIISVCKQILLHLEQTRDIDYPQINGYIEAELDLLDDIIPIKRKILLLNYMRDTYLFIKNTKDDDTKEQSTS